ncbi:hypothetical protein EVAR_5932_1 [Eumeta japonica]|uniref:Uncharacterized protein n=1 Tax=Eumeta variegata TaxID=151549 RepID=A0A4C1TF80_EUMVA|nr:hypothetical protein EVAR_5932_1 [Eumeta japonica]
MSNRQSLSKYTNALIHFRIAQRTKLCRCEVGKESVVMAKNWHAGENKEGSGRTAPAHRIIRRQFRAAEFRALYCTVCTKNTTRIYRARVEDYEPKSSIKIKKRGG